MSGNIVSTSSTLNVGNSTSSTVNINSAATLNLGSTSGTVNVSPSTLNLGSTDSTVNIRGLPMLFTSITSNFASLSSLSYSIATSNYYALPYSSTHNLIIQWGFKAPDPADGFVKVNFSPSYDGTPYVFAQQYRGGTSIGGSTSSNNNIVIEDITPTGVRIDTAVNNQAKWNCAWLALGFRAK